MKIIPLSLLLTGAALLASAQAAPLPRPNVVVVLVDDMGWSDIGCYGSEIPPPTSTRSRRAACASRSSTTPHAARRRARRC